MTNEQLKQQALVIRNETAQKANTATRVGTWLYEAATNLAAVETKQADHEKRISDNYLEIGKLITAITGGATAIPSTQGATQRPRIIIGRAIPVKARQGALYYFANGTLKIKCSAKRLLQFPNHDKTLIAEGFSRHPRNEYFFKVYNSPILVRVTGTAPITLAKVSILDPGSKASFCFAPHQCASPFLSVSESHIVRTKPISTPVLAERLAIIRAQPSGRVDYKKIENSFIIRRYKRGRDNFRRPDGQKGTKRRKKWRRMLTTSHFYSRIRVWSVHRGRTTSSYKDFFVCRKKKGGFLLKP